MDYAGSSQNQRTGLITVRFNTDYANGAQVNTLIFNELGTFTDPGKSYPYVILRPPEDWDWGRG